MFSGRGAQSNKWDGKTGYRLHVSDLAAGISRREVERVFTKYGPLNEVRLSSLRHHCDANLSMIRFG